jgi:hypothetical protein
MLRVVLDAWRRQTVSNSVPRHPSAFAHVESGFSFCIRSRSIKLRIDQQE